MLKNGDAETIFAQALGAGIGVASTQSLSESIEAAQLRKTAAQNSLLGNGDDYQQYLYGPKTKGEHQALQDPYSLYAAANDPEGSKLNAFAHNPGKYDHYDQLHATQAGTTLGHATSAPKATESLSDKTRDLFHEAVAFEHEVKGEISHAANEAFAAAQTMTNDVKMLAHHLVASAGKGFGEAETWMASVGVRAKSVVSTIEQDTLTLGRDFVAAAELVTNRTGVFAADLLMPESILPGVAKSVASSSVGKFFSDSARLLLGSEKTPALCCCGE